MAFVGPGIQTPTRIQKVSISLVDREAYQGEPASQSASYRLVLLDQNDQPIPFHGESGNLIPHMDAEWRARALQVLMDVRAVAEAALLGG